MEYPLGPILVVEDIPNVLELLETTLRFKGHPVVTAVNGRDALEKIAQQLPVLVITDILMPLMDGFSFAFKLRGDPQTRQIPIIFLSATYVTPEDRKFALSLGAVRFMEKPVDTEEFLLTVGEVLTSRPLELPAPLGERDFFKGYSERLEHKIRHKSTQIVRIKRLLQTLPDEQKSSFEALLRQAEGDRDEIQKELDALDGRAG